MGTRQDRAGVRVRSKHAYGADEAKAERIAMAKVLQRAKAGDAEAIRQLVEKYHLMVWCTEGRFVILNGVGVPC